MGQGTFLGGGLRNLSFSYIINKNVRSILPSGLELDIYIPNIKLAIELNDPVHYIPMYGEKMLKKTKNKDIIKQIECRQLGISLLIIDISQQTYFKTCKRFLDEYYESHIKKYLI